jgi:hypothetical protein
MAWSRPATPFLPRPRGMRPPRLLPVVILLLCAARPAAALLRLDFEQKYFVHPGRQVWDFCLVRPDTVYHLFYHSILETTPTATAADTIWHATSPDLRHWTIEGPVLTSGPDWWEDEAIWAPDVIRDEAHDRWTMLYTGVDALKVQRLCAAHSTDLRDWTREPANPVFQPDSLQYYWSPTTPWSSCRDPFLYGTDGDWSVLATVHKRNGVYPGSKQGIVLRAASVDLVSWTDAGPVFLNDGDVPWHDLESPQYFERDGFHHLLFAEHDVVGISHVVSGTFGDWSMSGRSIVDYGGAPEVDRFDGDVHLFSRLARNQDPLTGVLRYSVRFDTLSFADGGATLVIDPPHPLDAQWASRSGTATLANPTYGDNTAQRGLESCGLVGNGWFGSQEYYQGPLSECGAPGSYLGDLATGELISHPFILTGDVIRLLVGGGHHPPTCYVALVDAATDTILFSATGEDRELMTPRLWDIRSLRGREAYIRIVDHETGPFGHINVDEIVEMFAPTDVSPPPAATRLRDLGPAPNPSNPGTFIRFVLAAPGLVELTIHDLRGRTVWRAAPRELAAGEHALAWSGRDGTGRVVAAGVYGYRVVVDGIPATRGKVTVVP